MKWQLARAKSTDFMVIADYSEVAISLLYYWDESLFDIYFNQERDKKSWGIKKAQPMVSSIKEYLLLIHGWTGCDSESSILCKWKPSFIKVLLKSDTMRRSTEIISLLGNTRRGWWRRSWCIHGAVWEKRFIIKEASVTQINNTT